MALTLPPGLTPPEVAFLCEMELVTVIPRQRLEGLDLLGVSRAHHAQSVWNRSTHLHRCMFDYIVLLLSVELHSDVWVFLRARFPHFNPHTAAFFHSGSPCSSNGNDVLISCPPPGSAFCLSQTYYN